MSKRKTEEQPASSGAVATRVVLMARRFVRAATNDGTIEFLGGDFVKDGRLVVQLQHDTESFQAIETAIDLVPEVQRAYDEELARLRDKAKELGCHVVKDGARKMPRFEG